MNIGSMSNNYIIPYSGVSRVTPVNADNTVDTSTKVKPVECQTCKNREYVDGSNERTYRLRHRARLRQENHTRR